MRRRGGSMIAAVVVAAAACASRGAGEHYEQAARDLEAGRTWRGLWGMQRVLHDEPAHAGARRALGMHAYSIASWEDVHAHLAALANARPLERDELVALGDALNHLNRFAAADSAFADALARFGEDARVLEAKAYACAQQGDLERAAALAGRAVALDPALSSARTAYASALQELGRFPESEEVLRAAPDSLTANAHALLGRARERAGDLHGARAEL